MQIPIRLLSHVLCDTTCVLSCPSKSILTATTVFTIILHNGKIVMADYFPLILYVHVHSKKRGLLSKSNIHFASRSSNSDDRIIWIVQKSTAIHIGHPNIGHSTHEQFTHVWICVDADEPSEQTKDKMLLITLVILILTLTSHISEAITFWKLFDYQKNKIMYSSSNSQLV